MKTKTKLVVSICALTLIFTACKQDTIKPLDCMGIENGTAITDDCDDCHKWTAYNYVTHAVRDVNDTTTEVLAENEMFASPNNPMNPLWNANCGDCMGVIGGTSISDDCGDCHKWTAYNYVTHAVREVNDTTTEVLAENEMFASPNNPMNPLWNASCTDCMEVLNGVAVIDSCGDCQGAYVYNMATHDPSEIVLLGGDTNGISATLLPGQVIILPEDAGNPYWNSSCN